MTNFRKLISFLLTAVMILSLFACGEAADPTPDTPDDKPTDNTPLPPPSEGEGDDNNNEETYPELTLLTVKNETVSGLIPVRARYFSASDLYTALLTAKKELSLSQANVSAVKDTLSSILRQSEDVGLYYDYAALLPLRYQDETYGNRTLAGAVFDKAKKPTLVASDEANLLAALEVSKSGDVIVIRDEIEIDMADLYSAGTVQNYLDKTSPTRLRIPEGVTLAGERGQNGKTGGVLKITSDTDLFLTLAAGASLDGLVIQGPNDQSGLSFGVFIAGDGASIQNCEIAGFADTGVKIAANDVTVQNTFFHRIQGEPGIAISISNGSATVENCLFSSVNHCVSVQGSTSKLIFKDNVDAGNVKTPIVIEQGTGYDADFPAQTVAADSVIVTHNTFLSPAPLFSIGGLPSGDFICENNLFAYHPYYHNGGECDLAGVDDSIYQERYICQNNVYRFENPYIMYKFSGENKNGIASGSRPVEAIRPTESAAPVTEAFSSVPLPIAKSYLLNGSPYDPLTQALKSKDTAKLRSAVDTAVSRLTGLDPKRIENETAGGKLTETRYTEGDYLVEDIYDLQFALISAKAGEVIFIRGDAVIDLSNPDGSLSTLSFPAGITIASDRGRILEDGSVSRGAVLTASVFSSSPLLDITANDITLSGLSVIGIDPYTHYSHYNRAFEGKLGGNSRRTFYAKVPTTLGIEISGNNFKFENCELAGFAIGLKYSWNNPETRLVTTVTDCYFHHLQRKNYGFAINASYTDVTMKNTLFSHTQVPITFNDNEVCVFVKENITDLGGVPVWHSTLLNFDQL